MTTVTNIFTPLTNAEGSVPTRLASMPTRVKGWSIFEGGPHISTRAGAPLQTITVGELSKLSGNLRWRQAVDGPPGSCAHAVRTWLGARASIYSGYGNLATGDNGTAMTTTTLSRLRGEDFVILVNPSHPIGAALLDRRCAPTTEWTMNHSGYLEHHDEVRLANARDVVAVIEFSDAVGFDQWTA